jgi:hypothetical protein
MNSYNFDKLFTTLNDLLIYYPNADEFYMKSRHDDDLISTIFLQSSKEEKFCQLQQIKTLRFLNENFKYDSNSLRISIH